MSPEHVAIMNARLLDADAVRAACAELEKPLTLGYELTDGPDGETVFWTMAFEDTVRFSLDSEPADLLFKGDWARMIRTTMASRRGEQDDPGLETVGDLEVMTTVAPAFAAAQAVGTVAVQFPDV